MLDADVGSHRRRHLTAGARTVSFFGTRSGANDYLVYVYWVYDSTGRTYYGNARCYWLGTTIFRGCWL
jgi:hypothetical protein